jgi:glycine cleavage system H lipoate-binding protein
MKKYTGNVWYEEMGSGTINIGFTRAYIEDILGECFHITQASSFLATEGKPLLTIETNMGLKVVKAPCTGTITFFSTDARDFPDKLTEESIVMTINPKKEVKPAKAATSKSREAEVTQRDLDWGQVQNIINTWQIRNN